MVGSALAFSRGRTLSAVALCAAAWIGSLSGSTAATFTSFDIPGKKYTAGLSINAEGDVAGVCGTDDANEGFIRWADGTFSFFGTEADSINDGGVAVGTVYDRKISWGVLRAADGTTSTISVPGAHTTQLVAVNASGVIVGNYDGTASFTRTPDGQIQTFKVPNSEQTFAHGINASGDIAGTYDHFDGVSHGFLRTADGSFTTFDVPGATGGTWVRGISDRGLIVGGYIDGDGTHAFQRTPRGTLTTDDGPNSRTTIATFIKARDMNV